MNEKALTIKATEDILKLIGLGKISEVINDMDSDGEKIIKNIRSMYIESLNSIYDSMTEDNPYKGFIGRIIGREKPDDVAKAKKLLEDRGYKVEKA